MLEIYHLLWKTKGLQGLLETFELAEKDIANIDILFAAYTDSDDDNKQNAFIIFSKDNELFLVNETHCSCCFGLEGDWKPKKITWQALCGMLTQNKCRKEYTQQLKVFLDSIAP